ncbi:MAG: shikimate kinase [bacterium]
MWTSFIGFMGSGKSTIAGRLRVLSSRPLVAVDDLVSGSAGKAIPAIFAEDGEAAFREAEFRALQVLDPGRNLVVDTGGGILESPGAADLLRSRGVVIWLDAAWDNLRSRLEDDPGDRPLVRDLGWDGLEALYRRRRRQYAAAADFRLRSDAGTVDQLARRAMLRSLLWERREMGQA